MALVKKLKGGTDKPAPKGKRLDDLAKTLSLPEKPNEPPSKLTDYAILIWGEKGIGKSSLAAEFPDAMTFMWEPSRKNLRIKQIPDPSKKEAPLDWERYKAYQRLILDKGKLKSIAIDTVDRCYNACFRYVCQSKGVKHPNDLPGWGGANAWDAIKREWEEVQNEWSYNGVQSIYISHARTRLIETEDGDFEQTQPTCAPACWEYLRATCDFSVYYGYKLRDRVMVLRGSELIWCATARDDVFRDPKGNPVEVIAAGNTSKSAYKALTDSFANKVYGYDSGSGGSESSSSSDSDEPSKVKSKWKK